MSSSNTNQNSGHFVKALGLFDSTNIVAGAMIGSGIFVVSQDIALTVGSPGMLLMVWLITGLMTLAVALSYGELAAMYPSAGGQYVYLRQAYSPLWGFLYGWTSFLVIQTGTIAAVGVAFARYLGVLMPEVSTTNWLFTIGSYSLGGKEITVGLSTAQLVAILVVMFLTVTNSTGVKSGKWIQNIFTTTKIVSLLALILAGVFFFRDDSALAQGNLFERMTGEDWGTLPIFAAIWVAMVGSMFSADAWNNITFVAGEMKNPQRNLPLALFFGCGGVVLLYFLVNLSYMSLLSFHGVAHPTDGRVATAALGQIGPWSAIAISIIVMISTFGCLNGLILAGPRLYWAMAQDKLFFRPAGEIHAGSGVPRKALWMQCGWAALLTISGSYGDLLDYVIFAAMLFYTLTVIGVFILRRREPNMIRPYKTLGYPVIPALYILSATTMMIVLLIYKPIYTWPGLAIVALGVPVYYLWAKKN